jgi:hypothetical protein
MSYYLIQELRATPNVAVRLGTAVVGGSGDGRLQHLVLREDGPGADEAVAADALFALIGARPRTDWLPAEIARDPAGFLLTGRDVPDDGTGPAGPPAPARNERARRPGSRRCAARVRQARGLRGRARAPSPSNSSTASSHRTRCSRPHRPVLDEAGLSTPAPYGIPVGGAQ